MDTFTIGSIYSNKLRREVQHLPEFLLTFPKRLDQSLLLSDIHPRAHESPESPRLSRGNAHPTDASNLSIRPNDSLGEVECPMGRQHLLNLLPDEFPIFRMHQGQIFFLRRGVTCRVKSVDLKQLRRPILEPVGVKPPTPHMGKSLPFGEIELAFLQLLGTPP